MDLEPFGYAIGISDIMGYRECPQRFVFGMRRHVELPPRLQLEPNEKDEPPEATNWTNAFGSAIHHAIHLVTKEHLSHEQAIEATLVQYGTYLTPEHVQMLRDDLDIFERRRLLGVTLIASEADMRVPLFVHKGQQVYFRFKLDALYQSIANPELFVHIDYKSSAHRKTPAEVHRDPQAWAYNWAIHEYFPECKRLLQRYDQLKFGVERTTKNAQQRADMKLWLIDNVKIILADETYKPKQNDWCRYCPLVVTCRETHRATAYWRGKLSVLAPLTKVGRKVKVEFFDEGLELERLISEDLPQMIATRKHIEHVEKELKLVIGQMTLEERERVGWLLGDRKSRVIAADGLRELHELMGDAFYSLVSLPITRLEELYGKPKKGEPVPPELELARKWITESLSGTNLVPAKSG